MTLIKTSVLTVIKVIAIYVGPSGLAVVGQLQMEYTAEDIIVSLVC